MKLSQAKDFLPIIQAAAEGKTIQINISGIWQDLDIYEELNLRHEFDAAGFRVKPEKKLRAWRPEEVPIDCTIRIKSNPSTWFRIAGAIEGRLKISLMTSGELNFDADSYSPIHEKCEHSVDAQKTWLPCGIEE